MDQREARSREEDRADRNRRLGKRLVGSSFWIGGALSIVLLIFAAIGFLGSDPPKPPIMGLFGDYIGGTLGALAGVVSLLILAGAFLQQSAELTYQRLEFIETREEMERRRRDEAKVAAFEMVPAIHRMGIERLPVGTAAQSYISNQAKLAGLKEGTDEYRQIAARLRAEWSGSHGGSGLQKSAALRNVLARRLAALFGAFEAGPERDDTRELLGIGEWEITEIHPPPEPSAPDDDISASATQSPTP